MSPSASSFHSPAPSPAGGPPTLAEVFAHSATDAAATAFALAQLAPGAGVLWVQDRLSRREGGRPHLPGIAGLLGRPLDLWYLQVARAQDVLWAMEQALGCPALAAVVGEVWGEPSALDFTATKRLALRAERSGVPAWLLRRAATPGLSAARERWRLASRPSLPHPDDLHAPGEPLWHADLFRSRSAAPGERVLRRDPAGGRLVAAQPPGPEGGTRTPAGRPRPRAA